MRREQILQTESTQIGLGKKNLSYVNENISILCLSCKKIRSTFN